MEDAVKTDVLESTILSGSVQFILPGRAQRFVGTACADDFTPEMYERYAGCAGISG